MSPIDEVALRVVHAHKRTRTRRRIALKVAARFRGSTSGNKRGELAASAPGMVKEIATDLRSWLVYFGDWQRLRCRRVFKVAAPPASHSGVEAMEAGTNAVRRATETGVHKDLASGPACAVALGGFPPMPIGEASLDGALSYRPVFVVAHATLDSLL